MKTWKISLPIICAQEHTPLVERLLDLLKEQNRRIDLLTDEIKRLKELKKKPNIKLSKLRDNEKKALSTSNKKSSATQFSSKPLKKQFIDRTELIRIENIAEFSLQRLSQLSHTRISHTC
jgi:hypothetical protein